MNIGSFGSLVFEVSGYRVLTPSSLTRGGAARWTDHAPILQKPISQFGGPELADVSVKIRLDARMGVSPDAIIATLRDMRDKGVIAPFLIGGVPLAEGGGMFSLREVKENWQEVDADGALVVAEVDISVKEYVENIALKVAKRQGVPAPTAPVSKNANKKSVAPAIEPIQDYYGLSYSLENSQQEKKKAAAGK